MMRNIIKFCKQPKDVAQIIYSYIGITADFCEWILDYIIKFR